MNKFKIWFVFGSFILNIFLNSFGWLFIFISVAINILALVIISELKGYGGRRPKLLLAGFLMAVFWTASTLAVNYYEASLFLFLLSFFTFCLITPYVLLTAYLSLGDNMVKVFPNNQNVGINTQGNNGRERRGEVIDTLWQVLVSGLLVSFYVVFFTLSLFLSELRNSDLLGILVLLGLIIFDMIIATLLGFAAMKLVVKSLRSRYKNIILLLQAIVLSVVPLAFFYWRVVLEIGEDIGISLFIFSLLAIFVSIAPIVFNSVIFLKKEKT